MYVDYFPLRVGGVFWWQGLAGIAARRCQLSDETCETLFFHNILMGTIWDYRGNVTSYKFLEMLKRVVSYSINGLTYWLKYLVWKNWPIFCRFQQEEILVGGLEHQFYFPINIGNVIIPIDMVCQNLESHVFREFPCHFLFLHILGIPWIIIPMD